MLYRMASLFTTWFRRFLPNSSHVFLNRLFVKFENAPIHNYRVKKFIRFGSLKNTEPEFNFLQLRRTCNVNAVMARKQRQATRSLPTSWRTKRSLAMCADFPPSTSRVWGGPRSATTQGHACRHNAKRAARSSCSAAKNQGTVSTRQFLLLS